MNYRKLVIGPLTLLAIATQAAVAQDSTKPIPTVADYERFESIGADAISPDGRWYVYRISRPEQDGELRLVPTSGRDTARVFPLGVSGSFTPDSRYLAWLEEVPVKEREKLTRERKPVQQKAVILDIVSGELKKFDQVRAISFSADGRHLALAGYAPTEPRGIGATLRIVDLRSNAVMSFGPVGDFRWSDNGALLAMTIATGQATANGIQLFDASNGTIRSLDASGSSYRGLAWRRNATDLLVARSIAEVGGKDLGEEVIAWRDLARSGARAVLDSAGGLIPAGYLIPTNGAAPRWSDDGTMIAIGLRQTAPPNDSTAGGRTADSASSVQIWHSRDVAVIPQQQTRRAADERRTRSAVWHVGSRVTLIGEDPDATPTLLTGWRHAVEKSAEPYGWGTMFGRRYHDLYLIDVASGERKLVKEKVRHSYESGGGRYLLLYDGTDYHSYEIASGRTVNLTAGLETSFGNREYDTPTDLLPPYGVTGWLDGDRAVLLNDRHDIWQISPDGRQRTRITNGADEGVTHRIQRFSFDSPTIDRSAPVYLTLHGTRDQSRGFARLAPNGRVEQLMLEPKSLRLLRKADSSATFIYRSEARDDSPDTFVSDLSFRSPRQLTTTNSFVDSMAWTRSELIAFRNDLDVPHQGILLYPADYDPTKKYPMIVYTYERLADGLHSWQAPSERSYYNYTAWTLNGYFVLMPDIIFRPREPGISVLESVKAAVKTVTDRGLVDPKRVGHVGHSWGGYSAAYLGVNGADFLATTISGAGIFDLVSFLGQFHWASGTPEWDHGETGQARMEVPYWEDRAAYERNSPIHGIDGMKIPMLMAHGNKDGTVEFFQATEFYNFARRAGKDVVLLVYDGEDHGFSRKPNQIDYHRRILEWFGHYLKGEPAPSWITEGVKLKDTPAEVKRVAN